MLIYANVESYLDFLDKHSLTQQQYIFLYMVKYRMSNGLTKYRSIFPTGDGSLIGKDNVKDLIDRGFLVNDGEGVKLSNFHVTSLFENQFLQNEFTAANEFWNLYPPFIRIDGNNLPLKNMDKYEFALLYVKRINYLVEEHLEVLKDLEFGKNHNLIKSNIQNFTKAESWTEIRKIRLEKEKIITPTNNSF